MIINLTPHAVDVNGKTIKPSGDVARVSISYSKVGSLEGIDLVKGVAGPVEGLPEKVKGTLYIVSGMVRASSPDRLDIASPSGLVRNKAGQVVGCLALEVNV